MAVFSRKLFSTAAFAIGWTILTIVLLCIPGSAIPGDGFWGIKIEFEHFDKVVHVVLFGGIVLFWGLYSIRRAQSITKSILLFIVFSIALGVIMEYIQFYFIPFRSFDKYDIVADSGGAIVAGSLLLLTKKKQKTNAE